MVSNDKPPSPGWDEGNKLLKKKAVQKKTNEVKTLFSSSFLHMLLAFLQPPSRKNTE
jgi:hypothetical protein